MFKEKKVFDKYKYDIDLDEGPGARMVAWMTGLMVFFITLSLTTHFALSSLVGTWVAELSGNLTVELAPPKDEKDRTAYDQSVEALLDTIRNNASVAKSGLLAREDVRALVEPWLGHELSDDFPLPSIISVELKAEPDIDGLRRDILSTAPQATVDTHQDTLQDIALLAHIVQIFTMMLACTIILLAAFSIAGMVRAKFFIHQKEVETLHLVGASDEYIARQFRQNTLARSFIGACGGLLFTLLAFAGGAFLVKRLSTGLLPALSLSLEQGAILIAAPLLLSSLIAHLTAQHTVMRELARLP